MRFFNTTGPCVAADHYMLPAEARLPDVLIFDQRPGRTWDLRLWTEEREVGGHRLHLRGA